MANVEPGAGPIDFWELLGLINSRYPDLVPILQMPGMFKAVADNINKDQATLEAAVRQTPYWQQTPIEQRKWDVTRVKDPATAAVKVQQVTGWIDDLMAQTGVQLAGKGTPGWGYFTTPHYQFLNKAAANNWDQNEIKRQLLIQSTGVGGEIATQTAKVMKTFDDYGIPLSKEAATNYGRQLTGGIIDERAITGFAIEQAKGLFPGLAPALDRGQTVRQLADPYMQIAQKELGVDPNAISFADAKWNRALNQVDPKTGNRVSQSLDEWTRTIRSGTEYGYDKTTEAKTKGAQLGTQIAQLMGGIG